MVDEHLLETFRTYLPEDSTVYSTDVHPTSQRLYLKFYCAYNGEIMRLAGMIHNLLSQCGYDEKLSQGSGNLRGALVTDMYGFEIVQILSEQLYGRRDALRHMELS